jgi:hypothetical protein
MILAELLEWACEKSRFMTIEDYINFCNEYLEFVHDGLQAVIVSKNENHYHFYQYGKDGEYSITRPINSELMITVNDFDDTKKLFLYALKHIHEITADRDTRDRINRLIYTCQQAVGAALDALPAGKSNAARKINGDLFERFIRLIITAIGILVREGTVQLPIVIDGKELFKMSYQHDLIIEKDGILSAVGSVKTSSKDRLDKIFVDKFLHNRLTGFDTPHFAVFLNDVQRNGREPNYRVNSTFLTGHFKGYTIQLNPLDGVYYCDLQPNMQTDPILKTQIKTLDYLLVDDIWRFS